MGKEFKCLLCEYITEKKINMLLGKAEHSGSVGRALDRGLNGC